MKTDVPPASSVFTQAASAAQGTTGLKCEPIWGRSIPRGNHAFDGVARLRFQKKFTRQPFLVSRSLNPTTLHLLALLKRDRPEGLLLVTTHVNERQANTLRKAEINFMDASGNLFLKAPDFVLWIAGRRATRPASIANRSRAFHPSGIQLLYALMTDPNLNSDSPGHALFDRPYRAIGKATGISPSTIGWIMADLIRQGYITAREGGVRRLVDRKQILERWVQGYMDHLRPSLLIGKYQPARWDWWKSASLESGLWSGEAAAALITGELKPGTITIFGSAPSHAFVLHHGLQKDPQGTVEFLKPFWKNSLLPTTTNNCVHPLLVYADLMSIDDERPHEVAHSVYERCLRSTFETA